MVALNLGSIGRSAGKKIQFDPSYPPVPSPKPTHFPATPYLQSIAIPPTLVLERPNDDLAVKRDPFARNDGLQHSSIYNTYTSQTPEKASSTHSRSSPHPHTHGRRSHDKSKAHPHHHKKQDHQVHQQQHHHHRRQDPELSLDRQVVDIVADYVRPSKEITRRDTAPVSDRLSSLPSPVLERPALSRASSFADQSSPPSPLITPSILSTESLPIPKPVRHNMRPVGGSGSRRTGRKASETSKNLSPAMLERMEELDEVRGLRNDSTPHVLASFDRTFNQSATSIGSRQKADKMLGIDANAKLASLYLVSGLGKSTAQWSFADSDSTRGVQPLEDSMSLFWRPEMLGSSFSGEKTDELPKEGNRARKDSKSSTFTNGLTKDLRGKYVPDAGPDGAQRLVSKAIKFAHPRDVEVVNSTLSPPTTCHAFTFTIPRHDTLAAIARTRLDSAVSGMPNTYSMLSNVDEQGALPYPSNGKPGVRNMASATELIFYGVTLTVWTHADKDRAVQLKTIKMRAERAKLGQGSLNSINPLAQRKGSTAPSEKRGTKRTSLQYMMGKNQSEGDITASETETGMSDSDFEGPLGRRGIRGGMSDRLSTVDSVPEDAAAAYDEASDIFWMPYAITMVSRFPIYDFLQDYLRLSWARFSKDAKAHMAQISRVLNQSPPRPGDAFKIPVGDKPEDEVIVECHMPGGLVDFDKGLMKVDFQLWPLFQAIDLDHIITCAEVALSNSGRVIFCSKHHAMLNVAVSTLKYIVELRGWDGIVMPVIHARDTTFTIEDPGPYIIGMPTECRYLLTPPAEVVVVDIDTNSLSCKSPPANIITQRQKREKIKQKLLTALGDHYPSDRRIPMEFKVSYPKGNFRNFNKFTYKGDRPQYLGDRLKPPSWWRHEAVISVFDKILADKHKKPSLIQRLMKSGMARPEAQLTVGEQLAKAMMRRRALHYVETRDDLELKVAKINKRLLKLIQEGDHWKKQFEMFEKYADRLTIEANELKTKIDRERREAKRLSNIANEQTKQNLELEEKLKNTEDARSEAMRQLSDMHQSIQELEREREDIMNSLEAQINGALAGLPGSAQSDTSSRPITPAEGDGGSIRSKASTHSKSANGHGRPSADAAHGSSRPMTADSMRSKLSVLGQVKGSSAAQGRLNKRASMISGSVADTERGSHIGLGMSEKGESMALRVASIQAKLELALSVVSSQRAASSSVPTDSEGEYDDAATQMGNGTDRDDTDFDIDIDGDGNVNTVMTNSGSDAPRTSVGDGYASETDTEGGKDKTPTASRRPSTADVTASSKGRFTNIPPVPVPARGSKAAISTDRTGSEEFLSADEGDTKLVPVGTATNTHALPTTNKAPIIMRPEPRVKGRSKQGNGASSPASSKQTKITHRKERGTIQPAPTSSSDVDGEVESDNSDLTTHADVDIGSNTQRLKPQSKRWSDEIESTDEASGKRLSAISTTTIAFGRAV